METGILFTHSPWWLPVCLLTGVAFAAGLYLYDRFFGNRENAPAAVHWAMAVFRTLAVFIISALLLAPYFRSSGTETVKPTILLLADNSQSMKLVHDGQQTDLLTTEIAALQSALSDGFDVRLYRFEDKAVEADTLDFSGKVTNISQALSGLASLYHNQNVGALILATDGIFNKGINPLFLEKTTPFPVYTLAYGDTTPRRDLKIQKVFYNKIAYRGDRMRIKADLNGIQAQGEKLKVSLYQVKQGQAPVKLADNEFAVNSQNFEASFEPVLSLEEKGLNRFRIEISPISNEITLANNVADIFIDVLDGREKILLIAHAPHPDVAAIKMALEQNKNYEVAIAWAKDVATTNLTDFSLLVLHQLPSGRHPVSNVLNEAKNKSIPLFFISGSQTAFQGLNEAQQVMQIVPRGPESNDVQAFVSPNFTLFTLSDEAKSRIPLLPPLVVPFGDFRTGTGSVTLLRQKIGRVETELPLLSFNSTLGTRTAMLAGEGFWRWRTQEFANYQNHAVTNELMAKVAQYLTVKADKRQLRVNLQTNIIPENEPLLLSAELYNDNFEPVNTPDVSITIQDENNLEYQYTFSRKGDTYVLNAGFFPAGNYSFTAKTTFNQKELSYSGQFSVQELLAEALRTQADHNLLFQMSQKTGGIMALPGENQLIIEAIRNNPDIRPIQYQTYRTEAGINYKILFFLIFLLLSLEWFLRKYFGGY